MASSVFINPNEQKSVEEKSGKEKASRLIFPTDLSRQGQIAGEGSGLTESPQNTPNIPYVQFNAYAWNVDPNQKKNASIFIRKLLRGSAFLPLPEGIVDEQTINWETAEGVGAKNLGQLGVKTGIDFIRQNLGFVSKFLSVKKGKTANDLQSLAFGLTDFREWNFSFKLMPKGLADSQRLAEIIAFFKRNSIADFNEALITYPSFFVIYIHFPTGDSGRLFDRLLIFKTAVIQQISVNYMPNEQQSFYRDGAPTSVQLDISMKELERVNRSEYNLGLT